MAHTTVEGPRFEKRAIQRYPVRLSTDWCVPDISGCCKMDNGMVVLCDWQNIKLKLFDTNFNFVSELTLPYHPWNLCRTVGDTVAVTVNDGKEVEGNINQVHFFEVKGMTISPVGKMSLNHTCCAVVYFRDELYIGTRNAIYKYSMLGQPLGKMYEDNSMNDTVCKFAFSKDGSKIYIPNMGRGVLVTSDLTGRIENVLKNPERPMHPSAVTVLPNGHVVVCIYSTHEVMLADQAGKSFLSTLACKGEGIVKPKSVWFHTSTNELIVGQRSNNLCVIELQQM